MNEEEALNERRRITDQEVTRRDRFKNWLIGLLIGLVIALSSSGLTVWAMSPSVRANTQGIMTNNIQVDAMVKSFVKLETLMMESAEKQSNIIIAITRLEAVK